jgi:hypothetical protein
MRAGFLIVLSLVSLLFARSQTVDPQALDSLSRSMEQERARVSGRQDSLAKRIDSGQRKQQQSVMAGKAGRPEKGPKGEKGALACILALTGVLVVVIVWRSRRPS